MIRSPIILAHPLMQAKILSNIILGTRAELNVLICDEYQGSTQAT